MKRALSLEFLNSFFLNLPSPMLGSHCLLCLSSPHPCFILILVPKPYYHDTVAPHGFRFATGNLTGISMCCYQWAAAGWFMASVLRGDTDMNRDGRFVLDRMGIFKEQPLRCVKSPGVVLGPRQKGDRSVSALRTFKRA